MRDCGQTTIPPPCDPYDCECYNDAERVARNKHRQRQREGHHTPDWEGLSDAMRDELIYREINSPSTSNVNC